MSNTQSAASSRKTVMVCRYQNSYDVSNMNAASLCCAGFLLAVSLCGAQDDGKNTTSPSKPGLSEPIRVEAKPDKGFLYPYYLYVPLPLAVKQAEGTTLTLLVMPNNTGKTDNNFALHDSSAKRSVVRAADFVTNLGVVLLVPVFPRPATDGKVYTHALDRDALVTQKKELQRFDLQLIGMIDDARAELRSKGLVLDSRVFMYGFSAAGMFTNRFAMLHPDRVKAAAFGSPGGWAMAPLSEWNGKTLRYPIGVADIELVAGKRLDMASVKKMPLFLFMGADDTNDSVVYRDSYDQEDQDLIFDLFGKTLLERWRITEAMYKETLPAATLKLYPGVAHSVTKEMWSDVAAFFTKHLHD